MQSNSSTRFFVGLCVSCSNDVVLCFVFCCCSSRMFHLSCLWTCCLFRYSSGVSLTCKTPMPGRDTALCCPHPPFAREFRLPIMWSAVILNQHITPHHIHTQNYNALKKKRSCLIQQTEQKVRGAYNGVMYARCLSAGSAPIRGESSREMRFFVRYTSGNQLFDSVYRVLSRVSHMRIWWRWCSKAVRELYQSITARFLAYVMLQWLRWAFRRLNLMRCSSFTGWKIHTLNYIWVNAKFKQILCT